MICAGKGGPPPRLVELVPRLVELVARLVELVETTPPAGLGGKGDPANRPRSFVARLPGPSTAGPPSPRCPSAPVPATSTPGLNRSSARSAAISLKRAV